jgi:O-antigen/teichoic acid export membrane protein
MADRIRSFPGSATVARAVEQARDPLFANALLLMGNSALTAGLGFLFWTLAARLFAPVEVGLASAAISAAVFMATLAQLGLPAALVRFSPTAGADRPVLTSTVVSVVTVAGAVAAAVFVLGIDVWAAALDQLAPRPLLATGLITLAAATAATVILVYVAVGARDARPVLIGGVTQGIVKAVLVLAFAVAVPRAGFELVLAWLFATVAAALVQLWMLRSFVAARLNLHLLRFGSFLRYSAGNYAGDLAAAAPGILFPLLVINQLGAEANAYFYVAWAISSLLVGISSAVATSFFAEGSHTHGATGEQMRLAFSLAIALVVPGIAVFWVGAPLLLSLFGEPYAANAVDTLRLLSAATLPMSVNVLYLTVARVDRALGRILAITLATGGGALALGVILAPRQGITGVALGFLIAQTVVAAVLTVERWLRGRTRS